MQMRTLIIMGITILFVITGCGGNSSADGFVTADVTKSYSPEKNWFFRTLWMWNIFRWKQTMSLSIKGM